jgi:putative addiction module CopG family antidote
MNVNLGPVLVQFVAELLKTGHYQTQSEVLREGLRLLKESRMTGAVTTKDENALRSV